MTSGRLHSATEERTQRRLTAILAADVAGYSRLMEQDEVGTLTTLKQRRKEALEPFVAKHQGRAFKVTGDGVVVEFTSAVNAVQCAADLQRAMSTSNEGQPSEGHIVLRTESISAMSWWRGFPMTGRGVTIPLSPSENETAAEGISAAAIGSRTLGRFPA